MVFVGALEAYMAEGLSVGHLMGTSAGAITATFLAAGYMIDEVQDALKEKTDDGRSVFETFLGKPGGFSEQDLLLDVR